MSSYLAGVSVGEKVAVDLLELLHGQMSTGTVLEEAFVPLLNLGICDQSALNISIDINFGDRRGGQ